MLWGDVSYLSESSAAGAVKDIQATPVTYIPQPPNIPRVPVDRGDGRMQRRPSFEHRHRTYKPTGGENADNANYTTPTSSPSKKKLDLTITTPREPWATM